ncbi:carbamoyltransferase [Streptomyces sp. ME19-01-6]|uniref:carbamoyltransferase family protein n=1 Tax=Streptomyces sp. ME19-01-6 TaxID=3028686 RepID=UPI0029BD77CE|nr:carbamoyltransferase C-terminal domain-containing protein [Streptomyces sp. ME19-01-6]MDX3228651.1 carbamoyltransferase C-terminal domain-containing protein [Streptomyces sp. ME19-01-6]
MSNQTEQRVYLGISTGPQDADPTVAAVRGGQVIAYAEEERFARDKHAVGRYPRRALQYCLEAAGTSLDGVAAVTVNYNLPAYTDGRMEKFFAGLAEDWPVDEATLSWQRSCLSQFGTDRVTAFHHRHWRQHFGDLDFPPIRSAPHHFTHAFQAAMESPFPSAVVLVADGSGDEHTTTLWVKDDHRLSLLREIRMPHSLGWFYSAFTEYLGFAAYDGEYKVMGLAAHGKPDTTLADAVGRVLGPAPDGIEFRLDPAYIHYGEHSYSGRFTDELVKLLGAPPRLPREEVTPWHMDLAFAVQQALEEAVCRLIRWAVRETGIPQVCIGGGVGLNVKMNSRIFELPEVADVFAHPLCADSGAAAGAALVTCYQETGCLPTTLTTLAMGPQEDPGAVAAVLRNCGIRYEDCADLAGTVSRELAAGKIVGWCQGRLEAGPRALGQRSILADPRTTGIRDKVNAAVKQRELWRPFGPSMAASAAPRYFHHSTDSRFMTMAFPANDALRRDAPAIVHTDGSSRVQLVHEETHPLYHRLLREFEALTGVPVLLNTSFNVRGEPIVCTTEDALRTFFATGLDVLVLGNFVVRKP